MSMVRWAAVLAAFLIVTQAAAEPFGALARVEPAATRIVEEGRAGVRVELGLSQGVPWRLFTLDAPRRLVVDFREVDWTGLDPARAVETDRVGALRVGVYRPGWSRLVLELGAPMGVAQAALETGEAGARLLVRLAPVSEEVFAAAAGAPNDPRWDLPPPAPVAALPEKGEGDPLTVVIDPGHGGIDPGAERGGTNEKTLMLTFARTLREALLRAGGFRVVLTREDDSFVSLERRVAIAHEVGADVFLSLHADALSEGLAHGATVYTLAPEASDTASALLAERHDRDDLLAGVDLSRADDEVTGILLDLARQETQPRTDVLAEALIAGMGEVGGPLNRRPRRAAAFSVLKAADIPSVLIEVGFLSSPRDLENLTDPEWRTRMAEGIRAGLQRWRAADLARKSLVRQ